MEVFMKRLMIVLSVCAVFFTSNSFSMSLDRAVAKAERQYDGKIISTRTHKHQHVIRILTPKGKVRRVTYPANSRKGFQR